MPIPQGKKAFHGRIRALREIVAGGIPLRLLPGKHGFYGGYAQFDEGFKYLVAIW